MSQDGTPNGSHLTNEMRLAQMAREMPLVKGDEKILVFGANGQIGNKLVPVLNKLYGKNVIYCDIGEAAQKKGMIDLDVTDEKAVREFITNKKNNVKVIINLAALLSAVADQKPALAHKINFDAPRNLMKIMNDQNEAHKEWEANRAAHGTEIIKDAINSGFAGTAQSAFGEEPHTIRKLQIMSSMASQEFGPEPGDSDAVISGKKSLQESSSTQARFPAQSQYGQQKSCIETDAVYYSSKRGLDINIPCLAGVLNAHTPWPSNGTTEELDKMVVAAALHKVYGEQWEAKLRELIIAQDKENGPKALDKGHYLHKITGAEGKQKTVYVPEVTGDTKFAMVDGRTLAETVLMLLHKDLKKAGPVQNVYEYTSRVMDAASALKELNPHFPIELPAQERHLVRAGITDPAHLMECVDEGKMKRASIWAHGMDTSITESVIDRFKQFQAKDSIRGQYERAVEAFTAMKREEDKGKGGVAVASKAPAGAIQGAA
jgi:hypothetical protein